MNTMSLPDNIIKRLNEEYKAELNKIEEKYKEDDIKEIKELDYKKKRENS